MTIAFPIEETTRATTAPTPQNAACKCGAFNRSKHQSPACTCGASVNSDDPTELTPDTPPLRKPISEKKLQANRANAQKSTGPRTTEGKATVSQNATTHGLTSTTPPPLSDPAYSLRLYELKEEHRPTTPSQHYLVEQLAHIGWKLEQIPQIEAHLLAHLKQSATTTDPNSEFSIQNSSFPTLFAKDLLTEKPTPLTRLWDLHRRLLSQFQSILRQIPRLKKQAQDLDDQDEEKAKFEKDRERGERLDRFLADLPAHNARCDAAHAKKYNLPPDHPAIRPMAYGTPAQIKPTTESEISNSPAQIKPFDLQNTQAPSISSAGTGS